MIGMSRTDRLKKIVTPDYLRRICEQYQREKGYFSQREPPYLSALERRQSYGSNGSRRHKESSLPSCFSWSKTGSILSIT